MALPGGRLALGRRNEIVLVSPGSKPVRLGVHEEWVYGLAASPRHDLLLAGDNKGNARVWDITRRKLRCELPRSAGLRAASFDPSGVHFAVAGDDGAILIARLEDCKDGLRGTPVRSLVARRGRIGSIAAGRWLLAGDSAGGVSAWSTATWAMLGRWPVHQGEVNALTMLPDGGWISAGLDLAVLANSAPPNPASRRLAEFSHNPRALRPSRTVPRCWWSTVRGI